MQNEILRPVLETDEVAVPRYDVVDANGQVLQQNVELRLKNEVVQEGTPYNEESVLPNALVQQLGLPTSATPADAFAAVIARGGAKVSMNAPTAQDNVSAGYSIGATWLRLSYTLYNIVYSKTASDFVASACVVTKEEQTVTATGNGDDKVISATLEHGSESGWLYAIVTPDATAVSAKVIAGTEEVALTVGEANVVKHKYSDTGVTFEATYATANAANGGTLVIDNLTVIDETATLEQVEDGYRDVTDSTVYAICGNEVPFDYFENPTDVMQHVHNGEWIRVLNAFTPKIILHGLEQIEDIAFTCTRKGKQAVLAESHGIAWFEIPEFGEWTIRDNLGYERTILIDTVKEYHAYVYVQTKNYTMLYDYGDECVDVTGGWSISIQQGGASASKSTNALTGALPSNTSAPTPMFQFSTANSIDPSGYSQIGVMHSYSTNNQSLIQYVDINTAGDDGARISGSATNAFKIHTVSDRSAGKVLIGCENWWGGNILHSYSAHVIFITKVDEWRPIGEFMHLPVNTVDRILEASEALLANDDARSYMLYNCTGDFMLTAVRSSTFRAALAVSPYRNEVYANEHWAKFLALVS